MWRGRCRTVGRLRHDATPSTTPTRWHRCATASSAPTPSLVYLDGNSLGRPLAITGDRLRTFVDDEWGGRLIRGWDEGWFDLPLTLGDELGRVCLGRGARAGGRRRLDDGAALQADARGRRRPARAHARS